MSTKSNVVIERTYRATLQEVWELWTTVDGFESWWGRTSFASRFTPSMRARVAALRHDRRYPEMVAAMKRMGQPARHSTRGRFALVEPTKRLARRTSSISAGGEAVREHDGGRGTQVGDQVRTVVTEPMRRQAQRHAGRGLHQSARQAGPALAAWFAPGAGGLLYNGAGRCGSSILGSADRAARHPGGLRHHR